MADPIRVGILTDTTAVPADGSARANERILRLARGSTRCIWTIDREIDYVGASGLGLPGGTAATVEQAYEELVAADVLVVLARRSGTTPGCDAARRSVSPANDQLGGTKRARSEWMFRLQVGSHQNESVLLARERPPSGRLVRALSTTAPDRSPLLQLPSVGV